jgi:hypothetical protein
VDKGTAALLLAIRATARASGIEEALLTEWARSQPELEVRSQNAAISAATRGWRWAGEMDEIAATFAETGLPGGFHEAAAAIFRCLPQLAEPSLDGVIDGLLAPHDDA